MHEKVEQPVASYTEFEELTWVSTKPIPKVGTIINVRVNGIGKSEVLKYFVEYGFIGLFVQPLDPPEWYRKQNASEMDSALYDWDACHVYPAEVEELRARKSTVELEVHELGAHPTASNVISA